MAFKFTVFDLISFSVNVYCLLPEPFIPENDIYLHQPIPATLTSSLRLLQQLHSSLHQPSPGPTISVLVFQ